MPTEMIPNFLLDPWTKLYFIEV